MKIKLSVETARPMLVTSGVFHRLLPTPRDSTLPYEIIVPDLVLKGTGEARQIDVPGPGMYFYAFDLRNALAEIEIVTKLEIKGTFHPIDRDKFTPDPNDPLTGRGLTAWIKVPVIPGGVQ